MYDDDFDLDLYLPYAATNYSLSSPLHLVREGDDCIIGYVVELVAGVHLMIGCYYFRVGVNTLVEVPPFLVDMNTVCSLVESDLIRSKYPDKVLSLAFINSSPVPITSTRH